MSHLVWHATKYPTCLCEQWHSEVLIMQDHKIQIDKTTKNPDGGLQKEYWTICNVMTTVM